MCILLVFAGHLSAVQLTSDGMLSLLKHTGEQSKLAAHPQLIGSAIEEMLRYESPLQVINRVALEDVDINGKTIRKGQMILISLPAANRDPEQFADPNRFDITRADNRHIAFGYAIHYCAGAPLARLEGQIAIATVLGRFHHLQLAADRLERAPSLIVRGLKKLPVHFESSTRNQVRRAG